LIGLTAIDFFCGREIAVRRYPYKLFFLIIVLVSNIGALAIFKYLGFFEELMNFATGQNSFFSFSIIIPIGISFYAFQGIAYAIDLYRDKIFPEKNFVIFALFISFFPQLISGPIERAQNLIPQLKKPFSLPKINFREALLLILVGYFKKMVIADSLGKVIGPIYGSPGDFNGFTLTVATIFFGFQLYCDFSGYTDIARGFGKLMGINFIINFNKPYFSASISDFWRRWHISLSSWVRDYLYIPLGGNRKGLARQYLNLIITMTIMGMWHGGKLTFVIWGAYHGILLILHKIFLRSKIKIPFLFATILTFILVNIGWIFFRSEDIGKLIKTIEIIFSNSFFSAIQYQQGMLVGAVFIVILIIFEALDLKWRVKNRILSLSPAKIALVYLLLCYAIIFFGVKETNQFIYFQF
jgi:D-alanyl-lipoteichoic acid acyltransferase DltB (MBOAT superfamily)